MYIAGGSRVSLEIREFVTKHVGTCYRKVISEAKPTVFYRENISRKQIDSVSQCVGYISLFSSYPRIGKQTNRLLDLNMYLV